MGKFRQALKNISNKKLFKESVLIFSLALIFWLPRGLSLDSFVSTDEIAWLVRSANFYYALGQRDFENTYQKEHPGVTTMWVNTLAFLVEYPQYRGWGQGQFESFLRFERFADSKNINTHDVLVTGRSIMVAIHTTVLIIGFYIARRLIGFLPALAGFLLLSLEPYAIGITRLSHLDGLVGTMSMVSVLAFLVYALEDQKLVFLIVSAVGASLASLTKITGFIILPGLGFIFLLMILLQIKDHSGEPGSQRWKWVRKIIKHIIIFIVIYEFIYFAFWPAMWVNPVERITELVLKPVSYFPDLDLLSDSTGNDVFIPAHKNTIDWLRIPRMFLWRATPVFLAGLLCLFYFLITRKSSFTEQKNQKVAWGLIGFALVFTVTLTIPLKFNFRYWIPAFMTLSFLAGVGWFALIDTLTAFDAKINKVVLSSIIISIVLFQFSGILQSFPYYVTYYNPLMGGGKKAGIILNVGEGEGLDQAGEYLSTLPNAEEMTVMSWYGWGSFSYYFTGKTIIFPVTGTWGDDLAEKLKASDYLVTYSSQWSRNLPWELIRRLNKIQPLKTVWIDEIEYARIYKVEDLPPEIFQP